MLIYTDDEVHREFCTGEYHQYLGTYVVNRDNIFLPFEVYVNSFSLFYKPRTFTTKTQDTDNISYVFVGTGYENDILHVCIPRNLYAHITAIVSLGVINLLFTVRINK